MKKYVFTLKDDQLHIALIKTSGSRTKVLANTQLNDVAISKLIESYSMTDVERLREPIETFMVNQKKKAKQAEFILGLDSIISRSIEVPYLSKKELEKYLEHNISDLFTVDMDDYFYDYKIIQITKKTSETPKMLHLKLVVVPRTIIEGITKLVEALKLKLGLIGIYPDIMQRLVHNDESMGFLDIGAKRSILNIYDKGATFIYTSIDNQGDNLEDFTDEVEYFTDFYASRHQGEPLKNLYVIGDPSECAHVIDYMDTRLASIVQPIEADVFRKKAPAADAREYPVVILSQFKVKEIRGEAIDFSEEEILREKKDRSFKPAYLFLALILATGVWFLLYNDYLDDQIMLYSGDFQDASLHGDVYGEINDLTIRRDGLLEKKVAVESMTKEFFDYEKAVEEIYQILPDDVTMSSLVIEADLVTMSLSNVTSTVDLIEAIIAFNQSGLFEEVQLKEVELDNDIGEFQIQLSRIQ